MRKKIILSIITIVLLLTGCNFPLKGNFIGQPGNQSSNSITPTPFLPTGQNNNGTPSPGGTNSPTPQPTSSQKINLGLERPKGQVNILLLGSDYRPDMGYRTDVIMLLSLVPDKKIATLTSFPRDLYVEIPGIGYERINTTMEFGGFDLTKATFQENFDVPVDYYMITNFAGFVGIIDTLGGITVNVAYNLEDSCDLPQAVDKMCSVKAGQVYMDGPTALWYVRSRGTTSDFDRTRRAQEVILAVVRKTLSLDALNRVPELFDLFKYSVETNLSLDVVARLMPFAGTLVADPSILQQYAISEGDTSPYITDQGAQVLLPNYESIANIIRSAVYSGN